MSKMGELHSLVQDAYHLGEHTALENTLKEYGFKNPKLAANEFVRAYTDLQEKAEKVGIVNDPDDGSWRGR